MFIDVGGRDKAPWPRGSEESCGCCFDGSEYEQKCILITSKKEPVRSTHCEQMLECDQCGISKLEIYPQAHPVSRSCNFAIITFHRWSK